MLGGHGSGTLGLVQALIGSFFEVIGLVIYIERGGARMRCGSVVGRGEGSTIVKN